MKTTLNDYQKLLKEIDEHIKANFYNDKTSFLSSPNELLKENLKALAIQKYHQVYKQDCMFSALHSNAIEYEDIRQHAITQLIAEETVIADGSDSHYNLIKRFAKTLGATEEQIKNTKPSEEVINYISYIVPLCKNLHPAYGLLATYTIECQTVKEVEQIYNHIKDKFDFNNHAFEWFLIHGRSKQDHAIEGRKLILKHASDQSEFFQKSWIIVNDTLSVLNKLQNFYQSLISKNFH